MRKLLTLLTLMLVGFAFQANAGKFDVTAPEGYPVQVGYWTGADLNNLTLEGNAQYVSQWGNSMIVCPGTSRNIVGTTINVTAGKSYVLGFYGALYQGSFTVKFGDQSLSFDKQPTSSGCECWAQEVFTATTTGAVNVVFSAAGAKSDSEFDLMTLAVFTTEDVEPEPEPGELLWSGVANLTKASESLKANVEVYADHVLVKAWDGAEGYDMQLNYQEDGSWLNAVGVINGVVQEKATVSSGYKVAANASKTNVVLYYGYKFNVAEDGRTGSIFYNVIDLADLSTGDDSKMFGYKLEWSAPAPETPLWSGVAGVDKQSEAFQTNLEVYADRVIVKSWDGTAGYDLQITYDENHKWGQIQSVINGEVQPVEKKYSCYWAYGAEGVKKAIQEASVKFILNDDNTGSFSGNAGLANPVGFPDEQTLYVYKVEWPYVESEIEFDVTEKTLSVGEEFVITPTIKGSETTCTWASSNTAVATVENGLVKAIGEGTADITATIAGTGKFAKCVVTVEALKQWLTEATEDVANKEFYQGQYGFVKSSEYVELQPGIYRVRVEGSGNALNVLTKQQNVSKDQVLGNGLAFEDGVILTGDINEYGVKIRPQGLFEVEQTGMYKAWVEATSATASIVNVIAFERLNPNWKPIEIVYEAPVAPSVDVEEGSEEAYYFVNTVAPTTDIKGNTYPQTATIDMEVAALSGRTNAPLEEQGGSFLFEGALKSVAPGLATSWKAVPAGDYSYDITYSVKATYGDKASEATEYRFMKNMEPSLESIKFDFNLDGGIDVAWNVNETVKGLGYEESTLDVIQVVIRDEKGELVHYGGYEGAITLLRKVEEGRDSYKYHVAVIAGQYGQSEGEFEVVVPVNLFTVESEYAFHPMLELDDATALFAGEKATVGVFSNGSVMLVDWDGVKGNVLRFDLNEEGGVERVGAYVNGERVATTTAEHSMLGKVTIVPCGNEYLALGTDVSEIYAFEESEGYLVIPVARLATPESTIEFNDEYLATYWPLVKLSLNVESLELKVNETAYLRATCTPEPTQYNRVHFMSSDADVVEVDNDGLVYATGEGEATITAFYNGLQATCKVTVTANNLLYTENGITDDYFGYTEMGYKQIFAGNEVKIEAYDSDSYVIKNYDGVEGSDLHFSVDRQGQVTYIQAYFNGEALPVEFEEAADPEYSWGKLAYIPCKNGQFNRIAFMLQGSSIMADNDLREGVGVFCCFPLETAESEVPAYPQTEEEEIAAINIFAFYWPYDGTGAGMVVVDREDGVTYNLMGQPVPETATGILIKNGKKIYKK